MSNPAGWHTDPSDPRLQRYWDGAGWRAQRVWDGAQWVESVPAPAPPNYATPAAPAFYGEPAAFAPPTRSRQRSHAKVYGAIGLTVALIGIAIGVFLANSHNSNNLRSYPANVQTTFLHSCEVSGGTSSTCKCSLNYIEARVSLADYQAAEADIGNGGTPPQWVSDAIHACA